MPQRPRQPNEVSAGGVVVRGEGAGSEVCLVSDGRYWGLPKGNVEPDETPQQAALREIQEEVGLPGDGLRLLAELAPSDYVYRRQGRLIFKRVHQFLVAAEPGAALTPDGHEIKEAGWFTFEVARERASFKDTVHAIDEAAAILGSQQPHP